MHQTQQFLPAFSLNRKNFFELHLPKSAAICWPQNANNTTHINHVFAKHLSISSSAAGAHHLPLCQIRKFIFAVDTIDVDLKNVKNTSELILLVTRFYKGYYGIGSRVNKLKGVRVGS